MRIGSVLAALLGSLAAAQEPPELAHWQQVLAVEVPEKCRAIGESGSLRIDCGGSALLLEPADGDDPRKLALQRQLASFSAAGVPISAPQELDCTLRGEPSRCLEVTLSIHGASMVLRSGAAEDWVATCLHRGATTAPAVCGSVFAD